LELDEIKLSVKDQLIQGYAKLMVLNGSINGAKDENDPVFVRGRISALEFVIDLLEIEV